MTMKHLGQNEIANMFSRMSSSEADYKRTSVISDQISNNEAKKIGVSVRSIDDKLLLK
jgi:flagellar basal body rod protein FlgC